MAALNNSDQFEARASSSVGESNRLGSIKTEWRQGMTRFLESYRSGTPFQSSGTNLSHLIPRTDSRAPQLSATMANPDSQITLPSAVTQDVQLDLTGLSIHDGAGTFGSHDLRALECDPTAAQHAPGCGDDLPPVPPTYEEFLEEGLYFVHASFAKVPSQAWLSNLAKEIQTAWPQEMVEWAQSGFDSCLEHTNHVEHALFDLFQTWGQDYFYLGKGKPFVRRVGGRVNAVWVSIKVQGESFVNGGDTAEQKQANLSNLIDCFDRSQDQLMRLTKGIRQPGVSASKIESISA